jgi:hypothetical protein
VPPSYNDLFGNDKSWDATATILYRDSQDRASRVRTVEEATELMERALMSGDTSLARAVAMRATTQALVPTVGAKWAPLVDKWAESQPGSTEQHIGELADITRATTDVQKRFARNMSYTLSKPRELVERTSTGWLRMLMRPPNDQRCDGRFDSAFRWCH